MFVERSIENLFLLVGGQMLQYHNTFESYGESLDDLTYTIEDLEKS